MNYVPNLGQLCGPDARRDAVHVACAPVVASCVIHPGEHVGIMIDGRAGPYMVPCIGVADPYLKEDIKEGETFWLLLYPNTVTSLRHVWSHEAFKPKVPTREE